MARRKRTYKTGLIKRTFSYSTFEIAELFGIHRATVRQWYKDGLKQIDNRKPYLVNGADLQVFLKDRQSKRKRKCEPGELYCCRCRLPRQPRDNRVILKILNQKTGKLSGLCEVCGAKINKAVSLKNLENLDEILTIVTLCKTNLVGLCPSNVNTHLEEDIST